MKETTGLILILASIVIGLPLALLTYGKVIAICIILWIIYDARNIYINNKNL